MAEDRHRRRIDQIGIYFGKLARMFLYQNDWKVIPMAMLIAAVVSIVVKKDFFVNMEGTLKGALALSYSQARTPVRIAHLFIYHLAYALSDDPLPAADNCDCRNSCGHRN